jgi:hypothetical protein
MNVYQELLTTLRTTIRMLEARLGMYRARAQRLERVRPCTWKPRRGRPWPSGSTGRRRSTVFSTA